MRVARPSLVERVANALQVSSMCGGKCIEIVQFDVIAAGIVITADEPGIIRDHDAARAKRIAHLRPVRHCGEEAGLGPPARPSAGSAIGRGLVRVVQTCRSVAEDNYYAREPAPQTRRSQN